MFAIPGSIHSPLAKGCHQLIRQGAKLVDSIDDIARANCPRARAPIAPAATNDAPADDPLAAALGFEPVTTDELAARSGLDVARLSALLLDLELAGRVARLPGGRFQRIVALTRRVDDNATTAPVNLNGSSRKVH